LNYTVHVKTQLENLSSSKKAMAPQIAAYEREIGTLREELLKEIGHLEEKKEAAVKAAANCSEEHFQSLQNQFISEFTVYRPQIVMPVL